MKRLPAIALCLALAAVALADKLVLKDGRTYEGTIVEESDEKVTIRTAKATLTFPRKDVESIEKGSNPVEEREKRLTALDPDSPGGYLEAAEWLVTQKELADEATVSKLCNIASYLDPALAGQAQVTLGRFLLAKGKRPEAAAAFQRAISGDPANKDAHAALKDLKGEASEAAKKQMRQLDKALELVRMQKYKEAVAALRKCTKLAFADKAPQFLNMTIEEFANDLQSRLPCETCKGKMKDKCTPCKGTGLIECTSCGGTGKRKGLPKNATFAQETCKSCWRAGALLCQSCGAKRDVTINFNKEKDGTQKKKITLEAGVEKVAWATAVRLATWKRESDGALVTALEYDTVRGGIRTCPECKGIPYSPPTTAINMEGIAVYREEIEKRVSGSIDTDEAGATSNPFDESAIEDKKFRYEGGNWKE
ncbi:MAG: hypothetical protein HYY18_19890 [Planctomycetes bacterium]|nr:hypothetical protein [Planctomycetota bacterium]